MGSPRKFSDLQVADRSGVSMRYCWSGITAILLSYIVRARLIVHLSEARLVITRAKAREQQERRATRGDPFERWLSRCQAVGTAQLSGFFATASFRRRREAIFPVNARSQVPL